MSFITNILGSGVKEILNGVDGILGRFKIDPKEKQELKLQFEKLLQKRDSEVEKTIRSELRSKERILVAELQQGDKFTKRARPTVVYGGLLFIFINYCIVPIFATLNGHPPITFDLPTEFWAAWGGIVSTWVVGRSAEKWGKRNRAVSAITGNSKSLLID